MGKLRVWSVLLLGMLIASVSGVAMAASKPDGPGKPGGGGGYSKPAAPRGSGGYSRPAPPSGGYTRPAPPSGGYTRPDRYHKPSGDYYRPPSGYYKPGRHHDHDDDDWNVGFYVNPFFYWPWYYPSSYYYSPYYYPPYYYPPYSYPPSVVTVPGEPPVYIEREEGYEEAPQASASWYYCADPQGYYPYVKQCNVDWQPVAPRPPEAPAEGR